MGKWKYFSEDELKCHHCGECHMSEVFMMDLNTMREECGFPFTIRSGYRCPTHDQLIGGEGNHPTGKAIDMEFHNSQELFMIMEKGRQVGITRFGIKFEGVGPTRGFIHFDKILGKPQRVVWGYK